METLATRELSIFPGSLSTYDGNKPGEPVKFNASGMWFYPQSATTPHRAPNGSNSSAMLLDPRMKDSAGRPGIDEWWFVAHRYWPADYAPDTNDRDVNFHNQAGDAGNAPGAPGGIGWAPNFGSGVSALAMDWPKGADHPNFCVLCGWKGRPEVPGEVHLPVPERDVWNTYVGRWVAGRTDGSTVRPGAFTVWVNEDDEPHFHRDNIWTVQRAVSPADGQMYTQRWVTRCWEGAYTINLNVPYRKRIVVTRIGRTIEEALADRPTFVSTNADSIFRAVNAGNWPKSSYAIPVPLFDLSQAKIPPRFGGTTPDPEPPEVTSSLKNGDTVAFGTRWTVSAPTSQKTELWADGTRLAEAVGPTASVLVQLAAGAHAIGIAVTYDGVRKTLGSGGVYGRITVEQAPDPEGLNVHVVGTPTAKEVTIGWTPPTEQWGYVPTIDGSEKLTDQKRHIGVGATTAQVKIGRPAGGGQHDYGVKILGVEDEGEVTV